MFEELVKTIDPLTRVDIFVTDKNGNLRDDYCSDPQKMGIHFNYTADKQWVNYLVTHAPNI